MLMYLSYVCVYANVYLHISEVNDSNDRGDGRKELALF